MRDYNFPVLLAAALLCAFLSLQSSARLANPLSEINQTTPVAIGATSYGLYNISQDTGPYQVQTSEVIGYSKVRYASAYNATPPVNISQYGATLQLNAVMNVTGKNGKMYSYWIQDVMDLNTSNRTYFLVDNIWNLTGEYANVTNQTIQGNGNFSTVSYPVSRFKNSTQEFYGYPTNSTPYSYPLFFEPVISVGISNGNPVARIGYDQNGTYSFYDNVTFNITAISTYMLVTPYYETPTPRRYFDRSYYYSTGSYYDAEMVIGGEGSGEISQFSDTNATFWVGYLNGTSIVPFPVVGDFGINTDEAALNLSASPSNGLIFVGEGQLDYNESIRQGPAPLALLERIPSTTTSSPTSIVPIPSASSTACYLPNIPANCTWISTANATAPCAGYVSCPAQANSSSSSTTNSSTAVVPQPGYAVPILIAIIIALAMAFFFVIRGIVRAKNGS